MRCGCLLGFRRCGALAKRCGGLAKRCGGLCCGLQGGVVVYKEKEVWYLVRRCGGLVVSVPASIDRPSWVRISARRHFPTVRSEGRQITL